MNEDALLVRTERGLWAVADGMGGHDAGDVASSRVTESLLELPDAEDLDQLVESAVTALKKVNEDLIALAGAKGSDRSIGSTVVGLAIADGQFRCFWAGDSRGYRIRDHQIVQLTRDHSLVQDLVDSGMLQPDEAADHPNSNIITRAVGVAEELRVDTVSGDVQRGDQFLLATDGVTRLIDDQELAMELSTNPPAYAARKLIETILARGAPDNASLIITKII
ncbi:protein phosphatase 2C domain-containing protein [Sphingomonas sp. NSE70-1]|uniref:Protein phosphatase 2C domain-containing protein n=1 Tax=Sphingomonas caseinilyticus TaxID=2908205 RepID=A0ABT0RTJ0_9SPHN|nr:protein phosphatase 2C domain-containing protein [Sphingomonas caseinilyticus]